MKFATDLEKSVLINNFEKRGWSQVRSKHITMPDKLICCVAVDCEQLLYRPVIMKRLVIFNQYF